MGAVASEWAAGASFGAGGRGAAFAAPGAVQHPRQPQAGGGGGEGTERLGGGLRDGGVSCPRRIDFGFFLFLFQFWSTLSKGPKR